MYPRAESETMAADHSTGIEVESEVVRVRHQRGVIEMLLIPVQGVMHVPEPALSGGRFRRFRGGLRDVDASWSAESA